MNWQLSNLEEKPVSETQEDRRTNLTISQERRKIVRCKGYRGDGSCCTKDSPCKLGEGDCDEDSECEAGLKCGDNNCRNFRKEAHRRMDCCFAKTINVG